MSILREISTISSLSMPMTGRRANRHIADLIGAGDCRRVLAGNLTDALAGDERFTLVEPCHAAGNLHHIPAHDDGEQVFRALVADGFLHFR